MQCPKCNNPAPMTGPLYLKEVFGERLRYDCSRCGYKRLELCEDEKRKMESKYESLMMSGGRDQ